MAASPMPAPDAGPAPTEGAAIARRAGIVAVFTLLSRVLGYVRDAVMANVFGAGVALDAFVVAQTIPNLLRRLVAEGSLMIAFVPILAEEKQKGGLPAMRRFTAGTLGVLLPLLVVFTALGMLFPEAAVEAFASGFDRPRAELAAQLTQIMMGFLVFVSLTAVAAGALNTQNVFAAPAAAPILLNVAIIVGAVFGRTWFAEPMEAVAWAFLVGGLLQLVLQVPWLRREGLLVGPRWEPRHPPVQLLLRRMLPAVFGVAVYQLNLIVIRQIASFLPYGQISCYFWATRLEEFALGVFAVSIGIAALPTLSEHAAKKDLPALLFTFRGALKATNFITIPATVGLFVLAEPVVGVLFRHGRFTAEDATLTAELVRIMAVAMVPIGAVRVTVPTYYAIGDTRTPVLAATASLVATTLFGWLLRERFEIQGLTVATLLGAVAQVTVLAVFLRRRAAQALAGAPALGVAGPVQGAALEGATGLGVGAHALRATAAIVPGALVGTVLARQRNWYGGDNLFGGVLLVALLFGVGVSYLGLARLLGLPEVGALLDLLSRRLGRFLPRALRR
jgi:putative peptidoglycan lipid II flippase